MKNIGLSFIIVTLALILSSCEYNVENEDLLVIDPCEAEVSYSNTIRPLIDTNCMPCHNGDGSEPFAPNLTTYALVQGIAGLIKDVTQSGRMPKEGSLGETEKNAIKCWVENGALNN
ncbi:MAG: cytochrome c [Maribacter sp.]